MSHLDDVLLRAVAPAHLADAIIGDLHERRSALTQTVGNARARAICRVEALRSLPSLAAYRASRSFTENWPVALPVATIICAICVVMIPFWEHLGMGGGVYHMLRLFAIGLILGRIPRASTLGFAFLLLLIGLSDAVIDARTLGGNWNVVTDSNLYYGLFIDGCSMAAALIMMRVVALFARGPQQQRPNVQ